MADMEQKLNEPRDNVSLDHQADLSSSRDKGLTDLNASER
jgi:hypothetical protein